MVVPAGTYLVGRQTFANGTGKGYSYLGEDIVSIANCTKPVILDLRGVTIKTAPGLKYGSFSPTTGAAVNVSPVVLPYAVADSAAQIGNMFLLTNNASVEILGPFELDGNINNQVIGGQYGDTGWQLQHTGIKAYGNGAFAIRTSANLHHFGLDGVAMGWPGMTRALATKPHYLESVSSTYNGRLGASWVGGNHLFATNCTFSNTGQNGVVASNPGSGFDAENESGSAEGEGLFGATFINCNFDNNRSTAFVSDEAPATDITFNNCRFSGSTTGYAIWPKVMRLVMSGCLIVGRALAFKAVTSAVDAAQISNTVFSTDVADAPYGGMTADSGFDIQAAHYASFTSCTFKMGTYGMLWGTDPVEYPTFTNCRFTASGTQAPFRGHFYGTTTLTGGTTATTYIDNHGTFLINGVPI